jgi:hypothetical protein
VNHWPIRDASVADLTLSRNRDELISNARVKPHEAGLASVVSYHIREPEDVSRVVDLFRMNHERAKASAERRRKV